MHRGFRLEEVRAMSLPEIRTYIELLTGRGPAPGSRRVVNRRLKRK
ncbi:hypothetical protein [Nitratidesulfovibrio sp.]